MIGHLIYNYSHLDDVRIQQEISKKLYASKFGDVHLVHTYNGKKSFGYKKYLEDKLITTNNPGHYHGAAKLINAGLKYFSEYKIPGLKYVLVTAADTWLLNTDFIKKLLNEMKHEGKILAACSWGNAEPDSKLKGFSTDFFIIDIEWNRKTKLFPLDYDGFVKKFEDIFALQYGNPILEIAVQYSFHKVFRKLYEDNDIIRQRDKAFLRIIEREPVHSAYWQRTSSWPKIGLYTSPDGIEKQKILRKMGLNLGPYAEKFMKVKNLEWYNKVRE